MDAINTESVDKQSTRPFLAPHLSKKFLCRELLPINRFKGMPETLSFAAAAFRLHFHGKRMKKIPFDSSQTREI